MNNEPVRLAGIAAALVGAALVALVPDEHRAAVASALAALLPLVAAEVARRYSWGPATVAGIRAELARVKDLH
jgi:hypothetical protein